MTIEVKLLIAVLSALAVCIAVLTVLFIKALRQKADTAVIMNELRREIGDEMRDSRRELSDSTNSNFVALGRVIAEGQKQSFERQDARISALTSTVEGRLSKLQADNAEKLEKMRETVDEKLQKTLEEKLGQSFKLVSERLEQVYKGLGEMQTLASGVGDLKRVLSNVKTRGVLGEVQLGAILEQILAPEQYDKNVVTRPNTQKPVEFAVKMPAEGGEYVYLPVDAKFPVDAYSALMDAYDSGDKARVEAAAKDLGARIKIFAKDICEKYIEPPYTTEFAIMFLPTEGLYAEIVNRGFVEQLQRDYHVTVAGPTTMAALLNSLQMGFRTLAIQQRSNEVWGVLGAVKTEFDKFGTTLAATQQRLAQANDELDKLVGARTKKIQSKLREVTTLPGHQSRDILGIEDGDGE